MAESEGVSMQKVLDRAVEAYRRQRFLEEANAAYGALRLKPDTWREEQEEREAWEATLADGIPSD
ncbi:MAG: toxin-antitoxin system protein [Armatimonadetes bacterium]|nr:toxin-antitoxin system protein [Armatimonadota bacterium]